MTEYAYGIRRQAEELGMNPVQIRSGVTDPVLAGAFPKQRNTQCPATRPA